MKGIGLHILKSKVTFSFYCIIIILLVILPLNNSKELNNIIILHLRGDYFFHLFLFMPWAFFSTTMKKTWWLWLILGLIFASGNEFIQFFLPYRSFNINDLFANTIGVAFGFLLWIAVKRFMIIKS